MPSSAPPSQAGSRRFGIGLARAFGGALIFSLPMLMTMEMWWLGFYMNRLRLALLLLLTIPLLTVLSHYIGFENTFRWKDDVVDALVAYAVGFSASAAILAVLAILEPGMAWDEIIGKISLQAIPASLGAMLALSQLGGAEKKKERSQSYWGEVFFMLVGALFLAFNLAPTEEMVLIAYMMSEWHALVLALLSLLVMHAFVYAVEFSGQASLPPGTPGWSAFLRFTALGYAVALLISLYVLWSFGRIEGMALEGIIMAVIVLGFPAAIGAAAARLIL